MKSIFLILATSILFNGISISEKFEKCVGIYNNKYIMEKNQQLICADRNNIYTEFNYLDTPDFSIENDSYYFKYNGNLYINNIQSDILYDQDKTYIKGLKIEIGENGLYGIKNYNGKLVVPFEYDEIVPYQDCFKGKINGKNFIVNPFNGTVEPCADILKPYIVKKDDLYGLADKNNILILQYSEEPLSYLNDSYIRLGNELSQNPNALYDVDGNIIISKNENFSIFAVYDNHILVKNLNNMKMGVIDINKKKIIPYMYDLLYRPDEDYNVYYGKIKDKNVLIINNKITKINSEEVQFIDENGYVYTKDKIDDKKWTIYFPNGAPQFFIEAKKIYPSKKSMLIKTMDDKFIILFEHKPSPCLPLVF